MKKNTAINLIIIVLVIALAIIILLNSNTGPKTDEETAACIGKNSVLYVQLGCSHCRDQEAMFGDNLDKLTIIDCFYEKDKCQGITGTPTWLIGDQEYVGVKSIEFLKEKTGC